MAQMTMIQAITDALRCELRDDENVLVFGEDVGVNGGVFRATEGLQVGLSLTGFRPVPEIQFFGFVFEVMDSIAGQMARTHYRTGGAYNMPVTSRSPFGGCVHTPEMRSD